MALNANQVQILLKAKDQTAQAITSATKRIGSLNTMLQRHSRQFAIAGGIITGLLTKMALGANEQRKTQQRLAASLANVGASYDDLGPKIEATIARTQAETAVSDELQREALALLVAQLGDVNKAMAALPAAIDLAATSKKKLTSVVKTMGPALTGATNTISSLGIVFDSSATFGERLAEVQGRVGGSAAEMASPLEKMRANAEDLFDALGTALLPVLDKVSNAISRWTVALQELDPATVALIAQIGAATGAALLFLAVVPKIVGGIATMAAVAVKAAGAFSAMWSAMGGPVGLAVVAVITAVVGALSLLKQESEETGEAVGIVDRKFLGLAEGAREADASLAALPRSLDELQESIKIFDTQVGALRSLAKRALGSIPEDLAELFDSMQSTIDRRSGFLAEAWTAAMGNSRDAIREVLGGEIPAEIEAALVAIQAQFEAGVADPAVIAKQAATAKALVASTVEALEAQATTAADIVQRVVDELPPGVEATYDTVLQLAEARRAELAEAFGAMLDKARETLAEGLGGAIPADVEQQLAELALTFHDGLAELPAAVSDAVGASAVAAQGFAQLAPAIALPVVEGVEQAEAAFTRFEATAAASANSAAASVEQGVGRIETAFGAFDSRFRAGFGGLSSTVTFDVSTVEGVLDAIAQTQRQIQQLTGSGGNLFVQQSRIAAANANLDRFRQILKQLQDEAKDVPELQAGTLSHVGGMALVGERGPELVRMPRGTRVFNARETVEILRKVALGMRPVRRRAGGAQRVLRQRVPILLRQLEEVPVPMIEVVERVLQPIVEMAEQAGEDVPDGLPLDPLRAIEGSVGPSVARGALAASRALTRRGGALQRGRSPRMRRRAAAAMLDVSRRVAAARVADLPRRARRFADAVGVPDPIERLLVLAQEAPRGGGQGPAVSPIRDLGQAHPRQVLQAVGAARRVHDAQAPRLAETARRAQIGGDRLARMRTAVAAALDLGGTDLQALEARRDAGPMHSMAAALPRLAARARRAPALLQGSPFFIGGDALVGELGAELAVLPGAHVAAQPAAMSGVTVAGRQATPPAGGLKNYGTVQLVFPGITDPEDVLRSFDMLGET